MIFVILSLQLLYQELGCCSKAAPVPSFSTQYREASKVPYAKAYRIPIEPEIKPTLTVNVDAIKKIWRRKKNMTFNEYEKLAGKTAIYPNRGGNLYYPVLGLCGEAGEIAEKVKKIMRDKNGVLTDEDREALVKEVGDVLWYASQVVFELDSNLNDTAEGNVEKLKSRRDRGVLGGSGDNR